MGKLIADILITLVDFVSLTFPIFAIALSIGIMAILF